MHNKPQHLNNTGLEPHLTFVQHHNCSSRQHNILQGLRQHRDTEPQRGCLCNVLVSALQARPARVIEALTGPDGLVCKSSGNGAARRNGTHDLQPRPLPAPPPEHQSSTGSIRLEVAQEEVRKAVQQALRQSCERLRNDVQTANAELLLAARTDTNSASEGTRWAHASCSGERSWHKREAGCEPNRAGHPLAISSIHLHSCSPRGVTPPST